MNARGRSRSQGRHIGRRTVLGAGVVGAGAVVAWKVFGDSEESFATPPERQRAWTYAMDGAAAGVSRLTVSGGSLYVTARGPLSVHAVSTESGRKRWVAEVTGGKQGDATLGPVTVAGTTVYAVAEGGHVNAFADADGSRRWASEPLGGGPPAAPVVIGSTVCVLMRAETTADEAGGTRTLVEGVLCGLDADSGRVKWRAGGDRLLLADRSRGRLIAQARDGDGLSALDADTGERRWSLPKQDSVALGPKLLYATGTGTADELTAYDLSTGERRWKSPAPPKESANAPGAWLTVSADGRTVHACDGGTGAVYAYDATTGDRRWRITVDSPVTPEAASGGAASGGAALFLASSDGFRAAHSVGSGFQNPFSGGGRKPGGYVTARAASDGRQLWRTESDDCTSAPAAAGSAVLVAHTSQVWAYDARTGTARWRVTGEPGAGDVPLVGDGRLYVVTDAGIGAARI
ncbi:PQQ-binding-like beta-propeller repeat protein [Streptomyces sp. ADI92-24]|uniref:outer membrane protein assembly factor BamB family protein n=1 Tax=Streptomyces sp. ADI92-24 TaxID=1522756 RepID=UPI000F54F7C2|nr:PQQ-binding-like beta-propeller repeat protein [Streptomyces sp. ADI92-24]